jgi:LysM repeat protein
MAQCPNSAFSYTVRPGDTLWLIANRFHTDVNSILYSNPGVDLSIIYIGQTICVPIVNTIGPFSGSSSINDAEQNLNNLLRMLWTQHVYWTRFFIISTASDLPDAKLTADRLMQNPKDFEEALRPLYGNTGASYFSDLLTRHLTIAAELVEAAKAGNTDAADNAEKRWYANADEIASFLGSINPYWSSQEWRRLLYDHLAMTKNEAVDYLNKNFAASISTFNNIEKQALEMADVMTNGIVRQFPNRFIP